MRNFNPVEISNALKVERPALGNQTGVALYRLMRLVAFEDVMGQTAGGVSYHAGKKMGKLLGLTKIEDFIALCDDQKIGRIEVPTFEENLIYVDVYECVTCSGMEPVGRPLCHFEGGLIAGAVESIINRKVRATEHTCIGGLGHETCGFELTVV